MTSPFNISMLTNAQEKLVRSLHTKKGRQKSGQCLVEGPRAVEAAGSAVEWTFTQEDIGSFSDLVTTETPQEIAAVARIPQWSKDDVASRPTIVVLDGVQDPGNVGAILRLCLGFNASAILVESADVTSPKVIRSSAGAMFSVPWMDVARADAPAFIKALDRPVYRLERKDDAKEITTIAIEHPIVLMVGSEGQGIHLDIDGTPVMIAHNDALESLNVGHALAIALFLRGRF